MAPTRPAVSSGIIKVLGKTDDTSGVWLDFLRNVLEIQARLIVNILSKLYEDILPHNMKAGYGATFTPTWLADKIVHEIPDCKKLSKNVLDPACGTGTFLRSTINEKLEESDISDLADSFTIRI